MTGLEDVVVVIEPEKELTEGRASTALLQTSALQKRVDILNGAFKVFGHCRDLTVIRRLTVISPIIVLDEYTDCAAGFEDRMDVIADRLGHQECMQEQRIHIPVTSHDTPLPQ